MSKNVTYDKFLQVEMWAFRGKKLIENGKLELAKEAGLRIKKDLDELLVLLKCNPIAGHDGEELNAERGK